MDSFVCDFYVYDKLHRLEVLASPWKSVQKIYVDGNIVVMHEGKLVGGYMFYNIDIDDMPITVSIHDCGFSCEFNAYLDNTSIVDGSRIDTRKLEAERVADEGFGEFLKRKLPSYVGKTWLFLFVFAAMYSGLAGFSLMAISTALISYIIGVFGSVTKDYINTVQSVKKWFDQYQQWQP